MSTQGSQSTPPSWPKSDVRHWRDRLFKRGSEDWQVQIGFKGRQERFPLRTANATAAAAKARDIWLSLQTHGWEATRLRHKPWQIVEQAEGPATIGSFLDAVRAVCPVRGPTFLCYERKFRFLVAEICAIKSNKRKHDYVRGGHLKFRKQVDAVPLASITPDQVNRWRVAYLQRHGKNPVQLNHARQSAASILRNSKALFAPRILRHLALPLPSPLPFEGLEIGKLPRTRYRSRINLPLLTVQASKELSKDQPEAYKIFLLAVAAGLRRGEIDSLTWSQFDWKGGRLQMEVNEYGGLKTESSAEEIDMGPEVLAFLKACFRASKDQFVIASAADPRPAAHWKHYRCAGHFRMLIDWLRSKGIEDRNPLHCLRKEFGSQVNKQFGIFAASAALRHSSITLTREHYVDRKERIAIDLPDLLQEAAT